MVAIGSQPRRSVVGWRIYSTVIEASIATMQAKNTATGSVQAIQSNISSSSENRLAGGAAGRRTPGQAAHTRPIAKPVAM